jgi:prepilin-type N-terminal cleavage/methylation domain-containing protein
MPAQPSSLSPHARRPAGLTLIELLAVIAIIGVLAGLLIPVVGAVRARARSITSRSNLRQLALAHHAYENERGRLPGLAAVDADGNSWAMRLAPYVGLKRSAFIEGAEPPGVFYLPGVEHPPVSLANWGTHTGYCRNHSFVQTWEGPDLNQVQPLGAIRRLADLRDPARTWLVGEWNPPDHWLIWAVNMTALYPGVNGESYAFAFADSHVESFKAGQVPTQHDLNDPFYRADFWDPRTPVVE